MSFVKFELKKRLKEVKGFQVVTKMCQKKRLLDHSLNLVRFEEKHVSPNKAGGLKEFSLIRSDVGVETK